MNDGKDSLQSSHISAILLTINDCQVLATLEASFPTPRYAVDHIMDIALCYPGGRCYGSLSDVRHARRRKIEVVHVGSPL